MDKQNVVYMYYIQYIEYEYDLGLTKDILTHATHSWTLRAWC